jgi:hypothetical protein
MNKKNAIIIGIIGVVLLIYFSGFRQKKTNSISNKESSYYLTSPWVTERVGWFFMQLPEKWTENLEEIKKGQSQYDEISNEALMYEMKMKDFYLMCTFLDAKEGIAENWDLDKSATAMINQALYNLKCKDIKIEKLKPLSNTQEVNYLANSNCSPSNFKAKMKGIKYENKILAVCIYYKQSDENFELIANKIIESIENKYPDVENVKN